MKSSQSTTVIMLLLVCAVLSPVIAVIESTAIQMAIVAVQIICLLLIGVNLITTKPPKDSSSSDLTAK